MESEATPLSYVAPSKGDADDEICIPPSSDTFIVLLHKVTNNQDPEPPTSQIWNGSSLEDLASACLMWLSIAPQVRLLGMRPRPVSYSVNTKADPVSTPNPNPAPSMGQGAAEALRSWQKSIQLNR